MTLIQQIAEYLEDQSIGVVGTTIFYSYLPDTDTSTFAISIMDTGGSTPDIDLPTESPRFQIFIRSADYDTGKAKVDAIRSALHRKKNATLISGESYFYYILLQSEGSHLGRNEAGQDEFSMNFYALTR